MTTNIRQQFIPSFVHQRNRSLSTHKKAVTQHLIPKYSLQINDIALLCKTWFQLSIEIGSGNGEHVIESALKNSNTLHIACEVHLPGIVTTIDRTEKLNLQNLLIWRHDGRIVLNHTNRIDSIQVLFPDPWEKKRHNKRRIISSEFLQLCCAKLKKGGQLTIATDSQSYAKWIDNINSDGWLRERLELKNPEECMAQSIYTKYCRKASGTIHLYKFTRE